MAPSGMRTNFFHQRRVEINNRFQSYCAAAFFIWHWMLLKERWVPWFSGYAPDAWPDPYQPIKPFF